VHIIPDRDPRNYGRTDTTVEQYLQEVRDAITPIVIDDLEPLPEHLTADTLRLAQARHRITDLQGRCRWLTACCVVLGIALALALSQVP
jgi:hypothetical protein